MNLQCEVDVCKLKCNLLALCTAAVTEHAPIHRQAGMDADIEESSASAVAATTVISAATFHCNERCQLGAGAFGVVWYVRIVFVCVLSEVSP